METITRWLRPQGILLELDAADRHEVLRAVAASVGRTHGVDAAPVFRALWRREMAASTGVGNGFAIPHARVAGIAAPVTLYVRTRTPVAFAARDRKPVSEFFVILAPADDAVERNLLLLALVAEAFSDGAFRARLAAAADVADVAEVFARWVAAEQTDATA